MSPVLTKHARYRWLERFNDLDPDEQWERRRRPGQKMRKLIKKQCPFHGKRYDPSKVHYMVTPHTGVVWVVSSQDQVVVTVFKYNHGWRE